LIQNWTDAGMCGRDNDAGLLGNEGVLPAAFVMVNVPTEALTFYLLFLNVALRHVLVS